MKKSLVFMFAVIMIAPCLLLLSSCGKKFTYYSATIGSHVNMTVTSPNQISGGKISFRKDLDLTFYVTVEHGYDPAKVEVKINNQVITPSEIAQLFITYNAGKYNSDITIQFKSPEVKLAGSYIADRIVAADGNEIDHIANPSAPEQLGWNHGMAFCMVLKADNTLEYKKGTPTTAHIESTGEYSLAENVLSFTPAYGDPDFDTIADNDFKPGFIKYYLANGYYINFVLSYTYN